MKTYLAPCVLLLAAACSSDPDEEPPAPGPAQLVLNLDVDHLQTRLDNFGEPLPDPPAGRGFDDPQMILIGAHSAELVPHEHTPVDEGARIFRSPDRGSGVDFDQLPVVAPGEQLVAVDLSTIEPGTYEHFRLSVSFQRFTVPGHADALGSPVTADVEIASFVESRTFIDTYELGDEVVEVGSVKPQGYYGAWSEYTGVIEGQVPTGGTTVPNPLDATSPIPIDSCVVTATFAEPVEITDDATGDLVFDITLSTNWSFEWDDINGDGLWQPFDEEVVDMGIRGMMVAVR